MSKLTLKTIIGAAAILVAGAASASMTPAEFKTHVASTNPGGIKTYPDKVVEVTRMYNPVTKLFDLRYVKVAGAQATAIVDGKAGIKVGQRVHVATILVPGGAGRLYIKEAQ